MRDRPFYYSRFEREALLSSIALCVSVQTAVWRNSSPHHIEASLVLVLPTNRRPCTYRRAASSKPRPPIPRITSALSTSEGRCCACLQAALSSAECVFPAAVKTFRASPQCCEAAAMAGSSAAWMKDIQDRMKKATTEVNTALQPRVGVAKRALEEGMQSMGLRHGRELFDEDEELMLALDSLDELRLLLRTLATVVDSHRKNLLAVAATERQLGEMMSAPSSSVADLLHAHVAPSRVDSQVALGTAQVSASSSISRFALDMATPMLDLSRTFEETFTSKITALKKLYASQKTEYTRYVRQAAACDEPMRRSNLESIADSARPVWERTSETLRSEIQNLVTHATANMSEWLLNVAQAEAEMYKRSASFLEGPSRQAEECQLESP